MLITIDTLYEDPASPRVEIGKRKAESHPIIDWGTEERDHSIKLVEFTEGAREEFSTVKTIGEGRPPGFPANRGSPRPLHVAAEEGMEAGLFWLLLEQAGYQTW